MSETTVEKVEGDLNVAATLGAEFGGPVGASVEAGLTAVEGVANTVIAEAPHQTALTDVQNAIAAAAPIVAAAPINVTNKAQVTQGLSLVAELLSFFKSLI